MDVIETKLSALEDIKLRALYIEKRFMSNDPEETMQAESELAADGQGGKERLQHSPRSDRLGV
jgi:hypothetical protein